MPRLRDGVIKRGGSWSYVIRVTDPGTGVSRPKWVGGFNTEEAAKAARDEARVRACRGEFVNRSTSTVAGYLDEWVEAHAATVKPKTPAGYRHDIDHYFVPRTGRMRLQALRPTVISKLYRELAEHGGRDGQPLSATTVSHIHRTLRKALADAADVEQLLAANPAARSKRPRSSAIEPVQVWTVQQLGSFLDAARSHRLLLSSASPPTRVPAVASCCTCAGKPWTSTRPRSLSPAPPPSSAASALKAPPRAAGPARSALTATPWWSCGSITASKPENGFLPDRLGTTLAVWSSSPGGVNRFIRTPCPGS
jgi:Phage integrase, N-terminal SAM-like domain